MNKKDYIEKIKHNRFKKVLGEKLIQKEDENRDATIRE
jgi:hypothetical protein